MGTSATRSPSPGTRATRASEELAQGPRASARCSYHLSAGLTHQKYILFSSSNRAPPPRAGKGDPRGETPGVPVFIRRPGAAAADPRASGRGDPAVDVPRDGCPRAASRTHFTPTSRNRTARSLEERGPLPFLSPPISKCLQRLMGCMLTVLHLLHCRRRTIFFVVLAFFLNTGFVCPPNPDCLRSYRRFPCASREALPVLYCVTLCIWWFRHFLPLQKARFAFGTFTIAPPPM